MRADCRLLIVTAGIHEPHADVPRRGFLMKAIQLRRIAAGHGTLRTHEDEDRRPLRTGKRLDVSAVDRPQRETFGRREQQRQQREHHREEGSGCVGRRE
jgi:hypothetical protein